MSKWEEVACQSLNVPKSQVFDRGRNNDRLLSAKPLPILTFIYCIVAVVGIVVEDTAVVATEYTAVVVDVAAVEARLLLHWNRLSLSSV